MVDFYRVLDELQIPFLVGWFGGHIAIFDAYYSGVWALLEEFGFIFIKKLDFRLFITNPGHFFMEMTKRASYPGPKYVQGT